MKTGKLYVVGVGPGDPELLTLKAVRILREVPVICVPKGREEGTSLALSIVRQSVDIDRKEILEAHFPMRKTRGSRHPDGDELDLKWRGTVEAIMDRLHRGLDTAFITIGDPTVYSTFFYLYDGLLELDPRLSIEIVPGVTSVTAAAARAGLSLGLADERIAILPATYEESLGETLRHFDTVILMKVHRVFDKIMKTLTEMDLLHRAVYVSRAGMEDEMVVYDLRTLEERDLNYFSMVIVRK